MLLCLLSVVAACTTEREVTPGPDGFACQYHPAGNGSVEFTEPTPNELGEFDTFVLVRITGQSRDTETGELGNLGTIEEAVVGGRSEGAQIELQSGFDLCMEAGSVFYVIARDIDPNAFLQIPHPWATFPVINNRITLHPDMRKDDLVGQFHGLDPVLFERRFVEFVDRTDIEVD